MSGLIDKALHYWIIYCLWLFFILFWRYNCLWWQFLKIHRGL